MFYLETGWGEFFEEPSEENVRLILDRVYEANLHGITGSGEAQRWRDWLREREWTRFGTYDYRSSPVLHVCCLIQCHGLATLRIEDVGVPTTIVLKTIRFRMDSVGKQSAFRFGRWFREGNIEELRRQPWVLTDQDPLIVTEKVVHSLHPSS